MAFVKPSVKLRYQGYTSLDSINHSLCLRERRKRWNKVTHHRSFSIRCSDALHPLLPAQASEIIDPAARNVLSRIHFTPVQVPEITSEFIHTAHISTQSGAINEQKYRTSASNQRSRNVILLLHGFDSSLLEFREVLPELERLGQGRVELRSVDIFGWGFTEKPLAARYGVREKREHLRRYIEQVVGVNDNIRLTLVGCSLGGAVAADFAVEHPRMVGKLILVDPELVRVRKARKNSIWQSLGVSLLESYPLRRFAVELGFHNARLKTKENVKIGKLHCFTKGWREAAMAFLDEDGYTVGNRLEMLHEQNVYLIWGREDRLVGPENAQIIQERVPGSRLMWIDQCGHFPHIERPIETAQIILDCVMSSKNSKTLEAIRKDATAMPMTDKQ